MTENENAEISQGFFITKNASGDMSYNFSNNEEGAYVPTELEHIGLISKVFQKESRDANDVYYGQLKLPQGIFMVEQTNELRFCEDGRDYSTHASISITSYDKGDALHDINMQDSDGCTLMHYAVKSNLLPAIKFLLAKGASQLIPDKLGRLPSDPYYATSRISDEIQELLLENRAQIMINAATPEPKRRTRSL